MNQLEIDSQNLAQDSQNKNTQKEIILNHSTPRYKERISAILSTLNQGLIDKKEPIALSLLCMIAGKSIFFYGPPGSAKSLVARRIACAFQNHQFFDYLMNKFSTPEEIFGTLKLSELRQDRLVRNTEGYLPEADFAFLDEIWKSSPAILNTLLTIINEKKFRNGVDSIKVPLQGLIAASNELPSKNMGLEALYDRFIMRLVVPRIEGKRSFQALLRLSSASEEVYIESSLTFCNEELDSIRKAAKEVNVEPIIQAIILLNERIKSHNKEIEKAKNATDSQNTTRKAIKNNTQSYKDKKPIDISERRFIAIMDLLRVNAILNDRKSVELEDMALLEYCLWSEVEQIEDIKNMIAEVQKELRVKKVSNALENLENFKAALSLWRHKESITNLHTKWLPSGNIDDFGKDESICEFYAIQARLPKENYIYETYTLLVKKGDIFSQTPKDCYLERKKTHTITKEKYQALSDEYKVFIIKLEPDKYRKDMANIVYNAYIPTDKEDKVYPNIVVGIQYQYNAQSGCGEILLPCHVTEARGIIYSLYSYLQKARGEARPPKIWDSISLNLTKQQGALTPMPLEVKKALLQEVKEIEQGFKEEVRQNIESIQNNTSIFLKFCGKRSYGRDVELDSHIKELKALSQEIESAKVSDDLDSKDLQV